MMRQSRFSSAATCLAAAIFLSACDAGPKDLFSEQEIDALIAEYEQAVEIAQSTRGTGKPLMWTLSDEDTDVHMFGTIHVLPEGLDWRSDAFNKAFEDAHTLVTEVTEVGVEVDDDAASDFLTLGMSDIPLSDRLSARDYERVALAAKDVGIPMATMDIMEPWLAAVTLEYAMVYSEGYVDEAGVEVVLEAEAVASGKSVSGLETIEFQETLFDKLSEKAQLEYLVASAAMAAQARDGVNDYLDEWLDGDFAGMNALAVADMSEEYEGYQEFYDLLLTSRNEAWVPKIEAMLETPGTFMVAVGAGHLEGPDSVILMLRDKGYTVEGP